MSKDDIQRRLLLYFNIRTFAIVFQLISIIPALRFRYLLPESYPAYLVAIECLFAFNVLSYFATTRGIALTHFHVFVQFIVDLVQLSFLLSISKNALNPFTSIFFVYAGIAALIMQRRWMTPYLLSLVACLFFVADPFLETGKINWFILLQWFIPMAFSLCLVYVLMGYLSATLVRYRQRLDMLEKRQISFEQIHSIGALSAGLCHELATPLGTIQLSLERLKNRKTDPMTNDNVEVQTALSAVNKCNRSLRKLMDSRSDPDSFCFETQEFLPLLKGIVDLWKKSHPLVQITIAESSFRDIRLSCAKRPFEESFNSLLDNASDAMNGNGQIRISGKIRGDFFEMKITDQGPGWPDIVKSHFGEPFITTKANGTGLGLYNALIMFKGLGGSLEIRDATPHGGIVAIKIPLLAQEEDWKR